MNPSEIQVAVIVSVEFGENCYVVRINGRDDCLVVDPGLEPEKILEHLDSEGITPAAILNTHGHADHMGGNQALKSRWPDCPIVIGSGDAIKLTDAKENLSAMFGMPIVSPPADVTVDDGQTYAAAGIELEVRAISGHSTGHVIFVWNALQPKMVFAGDVIFAGSIGRTDFPDGSFEQLAAGIRAKLYTLPDNTRLFCGHGPATTVGEEKRGNPFVPALEE